MDENLGSLLGDVSRLLRRAFDERTRRIGVTRPQWQVLTALARVEGINQGALAECLDVEPITLCRMVDRLQDGGLVERRADPADRRAWQLFLTEKAHHLLSELKPLAEEMLDQATDGLSATERHTLITMLDRIRTNLTRRSSISALESLDG